MKILKGLLVQTPTMDAVDRLRARRRGIHKAFLFLSMLAIGGLTVHLFILRKPPSEEEFIIFIILAFWFVTERFQSYFTGQEEMDALDVVQDNVARLTRELDDKIDSLVKLVSHSVEAKYIGSHAEAFRYVSNRLQTATRMKDTFFRTEEDLAILGHSDDTSGYTQACLKLLERGGSIEFIFSKVNFPVAKIMNREIIDYINAKKTFIRWQGFVLEHASMPVINMVIMTFEESREVLFGWNYNNTDDGIVFSSRNERIIRYFDALFDRMRISAEPVKPCDLLVVLGTAQDTQMPLQQEQELEKVNHE
jgi:hypothetical protein